MSKRSPIRLIPSLHRQARPTQLLALLALLAAVVAGRGEEKPKPDAKDRAGPLGKCVSPTGTLLQREGMGKEWQVVKHGATVAAGRQYMSLPGQSGVINVQDGDVRLTLWGNLPQLSDHPALESVIVLHQKPNVDLDFSLERGRVVVANRKEKGPARVRAHFQSEVWDLTLAEPGSKASLDLYGRWPSGTPFSKEAKQDEAPTFAVTLLALEGRVELDAGAPQYTLRAPPGPAFFYWDSVIGPERGPKRFDKLPAWASAKPDAVPEALHTALEQQRKDLEQKPLKGVLIRGLQGDAGARPLAVYGLAATDDLEGLTGALGSEEHADVRETAIEALRHWMGRGAGQDQELYLFLVKQRKYSEGHAEIVLQLLHSFSDRYLSRPETYEVLIAYLLHDKLPIRELARWHLYRLVHDGKDIDYNAAGPESEREQAQKKWKKLIPEGQLPPKGKTKK